VLDRIEAELFVQARAENQRAVADHAEGVAVGRRFGEAIGGDVAAGPGDVLDHDRLSPGGAELLREQAPGHIRRDPCREADQDAHRLLGIATLCGSVRSGRGNRQPDYEAADAHVCSQSLPRKSVTRPSRWKNLFGTWNMARNRPPCGPAQASWRLPAGRQTNCPARHSPSGHWRLPSST